MAREDVVRGLNVADATAQRADGRQLAIKDALAELRKPKAIVFVANGKRPDAIYLSLFDKDAIVIIENARRPINADNANAPLPAVRSFSK